MAKFFIFPPKEFAKIGDFFAVGPPEKAKNPGFDFCYASAWHLHVLGRLTRYCEIFFSRQKICKNRRFFCCRTLWEVKRSRVRFLLCLCMAFAYIGSINALSRIFFIFAPKEFAKRGDFFAIGHPENANSPGFDFCYACGWHLHILGRLTRYREFFYFPAKGICKNRRFFWCRTPW